MNKNIAALSAVTVLCFGVSACNGDDGKKVADVKSPGAASSAAGTPSSASSSPTAAQPTEPGTPPATSAAPTPVKRPDQSTVLVIDPSGKRYTRKQLIKMSMQMAMVMGSRLPANFCDKSYKESIKGGGKFPAGRQAYLDACQEGIDLGR